MKLKNLLNLKWVKKGFRKNLFCTLCAIFILNWSIKLPAYAIDNINSDQTSIDFQNDSQDFLTMQTTFLGIEKRIYYREFPSFFRETEISMCLNIFSKLTKFVKSIDMFYVGSYERSRIFWWVALLGRIMTYDATPIDDSIPADYYTPNYQRFQLESLLEEITRVDNKWPY